MKQFTKSNLIKQGIYLFYSDGSNGPLKFVARFKYSGPFTMAKFKKELLSNHTPESYFKAYVQGKAPLEILKEANPNW